MAKAKIKKGAKLICVPCGREVVVDNCGISETAVLCCGVPMEKVKAKTHKKKK